MLRAECLSSPREDVSTGLWTPAEGKKPHQEAEESLGTRIWSQGLETVSRSVMFDSL